MNILKRISRTKICQIFSTFILAFSGRIFAHLFTLPFWKAHLLWNRCLVTKSCPNLWDPMGCSLPASSVQGICQARILEWVVIPLSRGSSWPGVWTHVSYIGRQILYHWATWKNRMKYLSDSVNPSNILIMFKIILILLGPLSFCMNFNINSSISIKILLGIWMRMLWIFGLKKICFQSKVVVCISST